LPNNAKEMGMKPASVAIAGFDDFGIAGCRHPRITTIAVLTAIDTRKCGEERKPQTIIVRVEIASAL
jgi:DNA-binding LacI/PurR family transcriptional regulator